MKKTMQWLYDNWMKATPFLALYSAYWSKLVHKIGAIN